MTLRDNRIYRLPNGREVVALRIAGQYILRNLRDWETERIPEYTVNTAGRLLLDHKLTAWSTRDLRETGKIAPWHIEDQPSRLHSNGDGAAQQPGAS